MATTNHDKPNTASDLLKLGLLTCAGVVIGYYVLRGLFQDLIKLTSLFG